MLIFSLVEARPGVYGEYVEAARIYLRLGDRVYHLDRAEWGGGAVVEEMTSVVPGGTCLIRVLFDDGVQRTFDNDLDSNMCCCFMGLKREYEFDWDRVARVSRASKDRFNRGRALGGPARR
ncbi:MAG: hypothetical protein VCA74_08500 [Deltaproteobacteria bacterium]